MNRIERPWMIRNWTVAPLWGRRPYLSSNHQHLKDVMMNVSELLTRFDRIETLLAELIQQKAQKEWYTTVEVAERTGRAEFTVREWCRLGRVAAEKEAHGRQREWRISHDELQRILNHGPRPLGPR